MRMTRALQAGALGAILGVVVIGLGVVHWISDRMKVSQKANLTKGEVATALENSTALGQYPTEIEVSVGGRKKVNTRVEYTFDTRLQSTMEKLFESYQPDYGAFVAMDAVTGRVLSIVSYSRLKRMPENLALRATFPSASVFKVVTAAAAIEKYKISANTLIPFNGRNHTLYKTQILQSQITRWTHFMSLKDAFAKSVNTVFGKIGAYTVGQESLRHYAGQFGFNRKIDSDMVIHEGRALIPEDPWGLAESASGYTLNNTMSPIQGALIAAAVANEGVMMEPYMVQSMANFDDGTLLYLVEPKVGTVTIDRNTATEIRSLMKETVLNGTSKGSFRGFFKKKLAFLDVGGKTGSLTGEDPHGKVDWFVGYADLSPSRIAIAALTVHEKQWRVKSSYLARRAIEAYYQDVLSSKTVAKQ